MRIQGIAAQSVLTRSGVSRVGERREHAGLVTRESASEDRRGAYEEESHCRPRYKGDPVGHDLIDKHCQQTTEHNKDNRMHYLDDRNRARNGYQPNDNQDDCKPFSPTPGTRAHT
jgi:hypothetical protein